MKDIEHQTSDPDYIRSTFHRQMIEVDELIKIKYQTRRPTHEARLDALIYAASQLGFLKIEALLPSNLNQEEVGEEISSNRQVVDMWDAAIEGTIHNDWNMMKSALQDYARSNYTSAAIRDLLHEDNPNILAGEESQNCAESFVNLINSI